VFGGPDCTWISAWNELGVTFSTTNPTEVAASLVFVVQSPWAGLVVPNVTLVEVAGEGVAAVWVLEQADAKTKVASSTTGAAAPDQRGQDGRIGAILRGGRGANQGLS
jgi:hypothetical protein